MVPGIAESSRAATTNDVVALATSGSEVQGPSNDIAIREADSESVPPENLIKQVPHTPIAPATKPAPRVVHSAKGEASLYGVGFYGNRTANGEVFRPGTLTASHRTLLFGTKVRITNLWNGHSSVVRINDRGPFHGNWVIDLAHGAAHTLDVTASGIAQVGLEVLE